MYSPQETLDIVVTHLVNQGVPAVDRFGDCVYRKPLKNKTLKCAVGCLIPDEIYDTGMEGAAITYSPNFVRTINELGHSPYLCRELQKIHDKWWKVGFKIDEKNRHLQNLSAWKKLEELAFRLDLELYTLDYYKD